MSAEIKIELNGTQTSDGCCQVGESFCQKPSPEHWDKSSFLDPTMVEFEREMRNSMMGKVMENLEKQMMEQTKMIDDFKHRQDQTQKQLNKERNSQHIPSQLKNEGVKSSDIWLSVHQFITDPDFDEDFNPNRKANMKCLDPQIYQLILSHGIGAWLTTLDVKHMRKLMRKIFSETSQWISKIWRFRCSTSLFHDQQYDGFLKVCKVALADRYPKYVTEGYNSLYSRPPVIYVNSSANADMLDYLRIHLGLPKDSVSLVPNNFELGGDESMDPMALEQLVLADLAAGKMPLIIYAFAGSPNTGSLDLLNDIHNICLEHKIWLHIEGLRLAQLALLQVPPKVNTISSKVKSMSLDIGSWLGIPAVPHVTLVMTNVNEKYLHQVGFGVGNKVACSRSLMAIFPIWMGLQLMGHDGITDRIQSNTKISGEIFKCLKDIPSLKVISRVKPIMTKSNVKQENPNKLVIEASGVKNLMETVLAFLLEGYQTPSVILFRYSPSVARHGGDVNLIKPVNCTNHLEEGSNIRKPRFVDSEDCEDRLYLNSLNQWLSENLLASFPQMNLKTIELPAEGLCLRICCQENIIGPDVKMEDVQKFVAAIKQHITIMDSTVTRRALFQDIIAEKQELVFIDLPAWAGLGSVLYLPESCRKLILKEFYDLCETDEDMTFVHFLGTSAFLDDINAINRSLIIELRNDDEAFSLGRFDIDLCDVSGERTMVSLFCVRFGLITQTTVIETLVDHVLSKAQQIEESSKYLEKLSQLVKDGIVKVTEDLAREQEEKVKQEGIFRQVPYIDSIINWWSPPIKTQIIGRSLNLSSGEINVTEDIYKYKMQLQTGPNSIFSIGISNQIEDSSPKM